MQEFIIVFMIIVKMIHNNEDDSYETYNKMFAIKYKINLSKNKIKNR
jgi:hypothetical protein